MQPTTRFALLAALLSACSTDASTPPADAGRDLDGSALCTSDEACDDGLFCTGVEICDPAAALADARGCVRRAVCGPEQLCVEAESRCVTVCAIDPDADGDGANAIECGGSDCDDSDARRYPGAVEICALEDPELDEDCVPTTFGDRDADRDGFDDARCCNTDMGVTRCADDCNDQRRDVRPGNSEVCDGLDNDCDGTVDEGVSRLGYADLDFDLHGDPASPLEACADTPGFSVLADDCDDTNPVRHRAQVEICDEVDNDCDGLVDEAPAAVPWYPDEDDDGFGDASADGAVVSCVPIPGYSTRGSDCDDTRRSASPAAPEQCNGLDDDCNGRADYRIDAVDGEDDDEDGIADVRCGGADANDADPDVGPGAPELCDEIDNDLDGMVDESPVELSWFLDRDRDGFGDESAPAVSSCAPQPGRVARGGDCDDGLASVRPGVADVICDGRDDDCDGAADEGAFDRRLAARDADMDGFGDASATPELVCGDPTAAPFGDCDDADPTRRPGAPEACDGVDDDCDGSVDEALDAPVYLDRDGDGRGDPATASTTCSPPAGSVTLGGDCDDTTRDRFPGNTERCDGLDQDCDAAIDEMASCVFEGGTGVCSTGVCALTSCMMGRADCDARESTGCETSTETNPSHCGACGAACEPGDTCGRTTPGMCDRSPVIQLAMGAYHVLALREGGLVVAWGANARGQLGTGGTTDVGEPALLPLRDVVQVTAGENHSCALDARGRVWCWGANDRGQLGVGASPTSGALLDRLSPVEVRGLPEIRQVDAGFAHTCALTTTGRLFCWGENGNGALGSPGGASIVPTPREVVDITDAVEVSAFGDNTCARRPRPGGGFRVVCWGSFTGGGATGSPQIEIAGIPDDVVGLADGGAPANCAYTSSGSAHCWGVGEWLGGAATSLLVAVTPLGLDAGVVGISLNAGDWMSSTCNAYYTGCALVRTSASAVAARCWGERRFGTIGDGLIDASFTTPTPVGSPVIDDWVQIVAGGETAACGIRADGRVACWGMDRLEVLGNDACPMAPPTMPVVPRAGCPGQAGLTSPLPGPVCFPE